MLYYLTKKKIVLISGFLFVILVLFLFLILPAIKEIKSIKGRIANKTEILNTIKTMGREYIDTRDELLALEKAAIGTDEKAVLLSALERLLINAGIEKESVTINSKYKALSPSISKKDVEMKFEKVSYDDLKKFLIAIKDYSSTLHLKRLHIKTRFDNPSLFNGSIHISVLERG